VSDRGRHWLDTAPDLPSLAAAFPDRFPFLLESTARGSLGQCSILMYAQGERLLAWPDRAPEGPGCGDSFFDRLEDWYQAEKSGQPESPGPDEPPIPFQGGWFLFLGYEMAGEIEIRLELPPNTTGLPDAIAWRCPGAVVVLHGQEDGQADRAVAVAETADVLAEILGSLEAAPAVPSDPPPALSSLNEEDPEQFIQSVGRIHQYLLDGDVFQVNISRPWEGRFPVDANPLDLYRSLSRANPAPFSGMMRWKDYALLSSSPERLVQIRQGQVQTRPIAGTRPRGEDLAQDEALSRELIDNDKERAEHIMLIDLERNDLGRVCEPGSVEVDELMVIESYAHVHHIVSNVRGTLASGSSPVDTIKAVFPGGTITGCPKVRCMEIIAELEGEGRSFYTGSMGYLGRDGSLDMNILIRSMLLRGNGISFRTGAGIVADSIPEQEVEETIDKARGLLLALQPTPSEKDNA
jgi:anthranilate synthase component 1